MFSSSDFILLVLFEMYTPILSSTWILQDGKGYRFDTICAVARSDVRMREIYHVNFLATRIGADDKDQDKRVLFFAQVLRGTYRPRTERGDYDFGRKNQRDNYFDGNNRAMRSFCCPVPISVFLGKSKYCACTQMKM
jgi:hypothetical protein